MLYGYLHADFVFLDFDNCSEIRIQNLTITSFASSGCP